MSFQSTKACDDQVYTFESSLFSGWALDGGMIMPCIIPTITSSILKSWSNLSFTQLLSQILSLYIDKHEIPTQELEGIVARAMSRFTITKDGRDLPDPSIITLHPIQQPTSKIPPIHVCELWHGPTLAFKDIPLQVVGQMLQYFLAKRRRHINIVVGTSGDTGSAALECIRGSPYASIFVLYPHQRISPIQTLQMTTITDNNCHVIACDGSSDDLDIPIKSLFDDTKFAGDNALCSINSVNICRILVQIAHFFYTYLRIFPNADGQVSFSLPTGAGGHLAAGMIAKLMGLPIYKLCVATNANTILHTFITSGKYTPLPVRETHAPAMDISAPYNIERVLWMMLYGHKDSASRMRSYMSDVNSGKGFTLSSSDHTILIQHFGLISAYVMNDEILKQIKQVYQQCDYLIDPHTAVGVHAAYHTPSLASPSIPILCYATAHASKFISTCSHALSCSEDEIASHITAHTSITSVLHSFQLYKKSQKKIMFTKDMNWESSLRALIEHETNKKNASQQSISLRSAL